MGQKSSERTVGIYRIKVKGVLKEDWSAWFDGLSIFYECDLDDNIITILEGTIIDQSALHGLLTRLHNLNLELISVDQVQSRNSGRSHSREVK